jgi:hypothetical protein
MKEKVIYLLLGAMIGWAANFAVDTPDNDAPTESNDPKSVRISGERASQISSSSRGTPRGTRGSGLLIEQIIALKNNPSGIFQEAELHHLILSLGPQDFPDALAIFRVESGEIAESYLFRQLAFVHWYSLDPEAAKSYLAAPLEKSSLGDTTLMEFNAIMYSYRQSPKSVFSQIIKDNDRWRSTLRYDPSQLLSLIGRWNDNPFEDLYLLEKTFGRDFLVKDSSSSGGNRCLPNFARGLTESGRSHFIPQLIAQFPEAQDALSDEQWENIPLNNRNGAKDFGEKHPSHSQSVFFRHAREHPEEMTKWYLDQAEQSDNVEKAIIDIVGQNGPFSTGTGDFDPFADSTTDYDRAAAWLVDADRNQLPTQKAWLNLLENKFEKAPFEQFNPLLSQAPESVQEAFRHFVYQEATSSDNFNRRADITYISQHLSTRLADAIQHFELEEQFQQKMIETNTIALEKLREQLLPQE